MIFEPYEDELNVINQVHKFNEEDYVLVRLTETMILKNNIDANGLLRDLLQKYNLVDYSLLKNGGKNGVKIQDAIFIIGDFVENVTMNFYRVNNKRSDPRFSIYKLGSMVKDRKLRIGDLLYVSVVVSEDYNKVILLNTTNNNPTDEKLKEVFGVGTITESASRLITEVGNIAKQGYHPNSAGKGKIAPKDVGDTLEFLLGIKTNNSQSADFEGKIEIKAKTGKTLDTLFTLRPQFDGTAVELIEASDRSRVSAFTRLYGYHSIKHEGYKSLYITIGRKTARQNSLGFFLEVNDREEKVELRKLNDDLSSEVTAFWEFNLLRRELHRKHRATLWVKAEQKVINDVVYFRYHDAWLSREPQFTTFLSLIEKGGITYDWRGYTSVEGKYQGKNHGNAWRVKKEYRTALFGSMEKIDLL